MTASEATSEQLPTIDTHEITDLITLHQACEAESGPSLSEARRDFYALALWAQNAGLLDDMRNAANYLRAEQKASPLEMAARFADPAFPSLADLRA